MKLINKIQLNFLRTVNYYVALFALLKIKIGSSKSKIVMNTAPIIQKIVTKFSIYSLFLSLPFLEFSNSFNLIDTTKTAANKINFVKDPVKFLNILLDLFYSFYSKFSSY